MTLLKSAVDEECHHDVLKLRRHAGSGLLGTLQVSLSLAECILM